MRLILATLALALPAQADTSRMWIEPGASPCFAFVMIVNRYGMYNEAETLQTSLGPVVLHYETIGGHNATDADQVDVVSLPDGVMADPMHMDLPDGETGRICLMEWIGG
jgi:hypothetical protein